MLRCGRLIARAGIGVAREGVHLVAFWKVDVAARLHPDVVRLAGVELAAIGALVVLRVRRLVQQHVVDVRGAGAAQDRTPVVVLLDDHEDGVNGAGGDGAASAHRATRAAGADRTSRATGVERTSRTTGARSTTGVADA